MGAGNKLIVCSGNMAEDPFTLPDGRQVYSVEELSYYIYENVIKLNDSLFDDVLVTWLKDKCSMTEISEKIDYLKKSGYTFKDRVVALLCSNDYYTEEEIIRLIKKMNDWEELPAWRKKKLFADEMLLNGQYLKAREEYEKCLTVEEIDDESLAGLYHNLGVAKMHIASAGEAAECFRMAYIHNESEESLRQCLIAYILDGRESEAFKLCNTEGVNPYVMNRCMEEYGRMLAEADQSEKMAILEQCIEEKHTSDGLVRLIAEWKRDVRG